ncbi:hypothetical protein Ga0466249_005444, partial [Sporomusaceae bacterium BoRhaA]|nr:hypothetical protein [Pelorhabdus rhamnosifermentans]
MLFAASHRDGGDVIRALVMDERHAGLPDLAVIIVRL